MFAALPQKVRDSGEQAAFHRASTNTETYTNQITLLLLCILNKIRYILPQSTDVWSFLHHSAIWIWWGSGPNATACGQLAFIFSLSLFVCLNRHWAILEGG